MLPLPRQRTKIEPADRLRLVTLSITWVAVPFTLFPIAEQHITSAVTGLLNGGTPIFAAIFAMVLLRQPTRGAQLLGIAVGFVGVVLVSLPSIGDGSSEAFGVALVVLATVCYGFSITIAGTAAAALRVGQPHGQDARSRDGVDDAVRTLGHRRRHAGSSARSWPSPCSACSAPVSPSH